MQCFIMAAFPRTRSFQFLAFILLVAAPSFGQNPVPQIVGPVNPVAVSPGGGAFTLTVYGANFVSGAVVNWNGQKRSTTFVSARELQAQILASDITHNTAGMISVSNPSPGGGVSSARWAQVEVHSPTSSIVLSSSYEVPVPYNFTYGLLMADFNGDNNLDLWADGILMLGNGKGQYHLGSTVRNYDFLDGSVYGDFNGDGKLDLAYVSGDSGQLVFGKQLVVALGDGKGKFNVSSTMESFSGFYTLATGDFNGDGKLDLLATEGKQLEIFLGNGDGTFALPISLPFPGSAVGYDIVPGDFNGDGKLDLATLDQYGNIYLLIGKGNGSFNYPPILVSSGEHWLCGGAISASTISVSDFNHDGKLDLLACTQGELAVFLGNGDGTFQKSVISVPPSYNALVPVIGDFNSDGMIDLLVTEDAQSNILIFWGNGDGTWQNPQVVPLPSTGTGGGIGELGMAAGDLNSDGLLDFIDMTAFGDSAVYIQKQ